MYKNTVNQNDEMMEYKKELMNLLEVYKRKDNELNNYLKEFQSFKNELNQIKEINNKTKDFLLLELESNLDKQKQAQIKQESCVNSFKEIINLLKEENHHNIEELSNLNVKIGYLKQCLNDKNNIINSLNSDNSKLKKDIVDFENQNKLFNSELEDLKVSNEDKLVEISSLKDEIGGLKVSNEDKLVEISSLKDEISSLKNNLVINDKTIDKLKDETDSLQDLINNLNQELSIKNRDIGKMDVLREDVNKFSQENLNLCSLINEKDNLINSLTDDFKVKIEQTSLKYEKNISDLKKDVEIKNKEILKLNNLISNHEEQNKLLLNEKDHFKEIITEKNGMNNNLKNNINLLNDKINILEKESKVKMDSIESLKDEIKILKSIIDEKDKTINTLVGR